jgi:hypothetical protein
MDMGNHHAEFAPPDRMDRLERRNHRVTRDLRWFAAGRHSCAEGARCPSAAAVLGLAVPMVSLKTTLDARASTSTYRSRHPL